MKNLYKFTISLLILFLSSGCSLKHENICFNDLTLCRFLDYQDDLVKYNSQIKPHIDWYNKNEERYKRNYDRLPISITKDGSNLIYTFSYSARYSGKYYTYYDVVDSVTGKIIDWNFSECNITIALESGNILNCITDTRVISYENNIYGIDLNSKEKKKFGYEYNDFIKDKDDKKIILSILKKKKVCQSGISKIISKNYLQDNGIVQYKVKCSL